MNKIVNTFLLTAGKFMSEKHLRQPGFTYSVGAPFTKNKERIQNKINRRFTIYLSKRTR